MPSPDKRARLEWLFRGIATVALAGLVAGAFLSQSRAHGQRMNAAELPHQFRRWTMIPPAETLGLVVTGAIDRPALDYLRALRANGTAVTWINEGLQPLMLETEPLQDPAGGIVARVTGTPGASLAVSDSLGILDSIRIDRLGATVRMPAFSGTVAVAAGGTVARAAPRLTGVDRSIVVLGMGGWEAKFVIRALEERGWTVESRIGLAPNLATLRGKPFPLDTTRQVAVIALDSSAAGYAREIQQFVRAGGGLIVGAAAAPFFARSPSAEVTTLVQRARGVTLAAWLTGSGRVIRTDQRDTWRWRMAPEDEAVANHRDWWAGLVGAVALRTDEDGREANPAPLASLVQELGPPGRLPGAGTHAAPWPGLLAVLLVSLFAEWLSRRMRGAA